MTIEVGRTYSTKLGSPHRMIAVVLSVSGDDRSDVVRYDAMHACDWCSLGALYKRSLPLDGPNWLYVDEFSRMYLLMAPAGSIAVGGYVPPPKVVAELTKPKPRISYAEFQANYLAFKSRERSNV